MAIDNNFTANPLAADTDLVTITEPAAVQLRELMSQQVGASPELGLRVFTYGGCCGISFGLGFDDQPAEDDLVINVSGLRMYVDDMTSRFIAGATIDYENSVRGSGFRVLNPNVVLSGSCG